MERFFIRTRNRTLPGRHITDCQMRLFMSFRQTETASVAAAKAGFSAATAYRMEQAAAANLAARRSGCEGSVNLDEKVSPDA